MAKKETNIKEATIVGNTILDKIMMGLAAFAIVALAWLELLRHIVTPAPMSYALAAGAVAFLLYLVFAPLFRK